MTPILAFDIETVPDVAGLRRLHDLPADLPDNDVAELAFQKRRVQTGNDFLPPYLQRVIVISCVMRTDDGVQVFSIGEPDVAEGAAIQRFFAGISSGGALHVALRVARELRNAVIVSIVCDRGDRYLSTGVFPD